MWLLFVMFTQKYFASDWTGELVKSHIYYICSNDSFILMMQNIGLCNFIRKDLVWGSLFPTLC